MRQHIQNGSQEAWPKHEEAVLWCADDGALSQVAQIACGVSLLGDLQNPAGHGHMEPSQCVHAWAGGLD